MKKYHVYYDNIPIGELYCDGELQKYQVNHENVQKLIEQGEPISPFLLKDKEDFDEAIPFFKIRIDANSRFDNLTIGFITDKVRLIEY